MTSSTPIRFAFITDSHIREKGDVAWRHLQAAIAQISRDAPDFVVFGGDLLCAEGSMLRANAIVDLFGPLACPVHFLLGNSDLAARSLGNTALPDVPPHFTFTLRSWAFIGFDTSAGTLSTREDQWLAEQLAHHGHRRIVLFTHYYHAALDATGKEGLEARLRTPGARHLISGHGHRTEQHAISTWTQHLVAGIDPLKPTPHAPGYDLFTAQEETLRRRRRVVRIWGEHEESPQPP